MIKANELRTGNKLLKNGEVVTVNNIFGASGLVQLFEEPFQRVPLGVADIKGIPITEELALSAGFEPRYGFYYEHPIESIFLEVHRNQFDIYFGEVLHVDTNKKIGEINFIHELQNIVYSLTKKELSITI